MKLERSHELWEEGKKYMPSGVSAGGRVNVACGMPHYIDHAEGARLYTVDNQNVQSFECNPYTTKFDVSDANETINTARLAQGTYAFKIHVVLSGEYYGAYYKEFTVGNPEITVTFDPNGGSVSPTSKTITKGIAYGILPIPTKTNYTFKGWYTEASGGSKVTSSTTVTAIANHTLYAHWTSAHTHDYKATVTKPTCTERGYTTYTCATCGDTYTADEVAAL